MRGKPRVTATSREAERRGIAAGMPLAEAKALAADLLALPWDEERITRAALEAVTAFLAASPRVSWAGMGHTAHCASARLGTVGVWWIDAAGLGSEAKLAGRLLTIASGLGFGPARAGIASSAIAAYAATYASRRHQHRGTLPVVVPPGGDAAYLAPFPVTLLDLDDVRVSCLDELAHSAEGFPAPVPQFGDSIRDELRCRLALARA